MQSTAMALEAVTATVIVRLAAITRNDFLVKKSMKHRISSSYPLFKWEFLFCERRCDIVRSIKIGNSTDHCRILAVKHFIDDQGMKFSGCETILKRVSSVHVLRSDRDNTSLSDLNSTN